MIDLASALFGATLLGLGVLIGAHVTRLCVRLRAPQSAPRLVNDAPSAIPLRVETVVPSPTKPARSSSMPRPTHTEERMREMGADVVEALVGSGYKKTVAAEAAWGCSAADRATLETWTAAALRKLGAAS